jgi:hypothetical protein
MSCCPRAHMNIGLSAPALVLTFDSREKVLDRIAKGFVPGLFGLAQVESLGPPGAVVDGFAGLTASLT